MTTRTNPLEVKEILDNTALSDGVIQSYIATANLMVTNSLTGSGLSATTLKEIERWLAAHLIASTRERMGKTEQVGEAQISYTGQWGKDLDSTPYGQMVARLDTTGELARIGKKTATVRAVESYYDTSDES